MHRTVLPKEELSDLLPFFLGGGPNFQIPFTSENPVYSELRLEPKIHLHRNTMYFCRKSNIQ